MKAIVCNACGRKLKSSGDVLMEDAFFARKDWGYFSKKDMETDAFTICESCYDRITAAFKVPITRTDKTEAM